MRDRRPPPPFRRGAVRGARRLGPRLVRVTVAGPELRHLAPAGPAASVRLLLPAPGGAAPVVPDWDGNRFVLPGGGLPTIRTLTPRRLDPAAGELDVDVVVHGSGAASAWAAGATPGSPVAVSGPGRGYEVDPGAPAHLLCGDETALAAVAQLLEVLPPDRAVNVHLELARPEGRVELPAHARATVSWHDLPAGEQPGAALVAAVTAATIPEGTRVWVAGEAAAVQRIRRHLFEDRGLPRGRAAVRGYWKAGRAADRAED